MEFDIAKTMPITPVMYNVTLRKNRLIFLLCQSKKNLREKYHYDNKQYIDQNVLHLKTPILPSKSLNINFHSTVRSLFLHIAPKKYVLLQNNAYYSRGFDLGI